MIKTFLPTLLLAAGICAAPPAAASPTEIMETLRMVLRSSCDDLAAALNQKIPEGKPDVLMFAGDLHEAGNCVAPDWEKAAALYQRAAQARAPAAVPRLIAIYAARRRDPAAALWWAAQRPGLLPRDCLPAANPGKQAAAFIEELRGWPAAQLHACTYHAGVMARLQARTLERPVSGKADVVKIDAALKLDSGTIVWTDEDGKKLAESRVLNDNLEPDAVTSPVYLSFDWMLWWDGVRTLQEFGRPPATDPRWTVKNTLKVEQAIRHSSIPTFIGISQ